MKINPPKPEIIPADPYKNDIFENRKEFGDSLTSLFTKIDESMVLCIDAQWGDGKTTFAEMWMADLKLHGKKCIYFNAFEHDYSDDPFISFSAEILSLLKNEYKELRIPTGNFKKKAIKIGKMVLPTLSKIALKLISFGIIEPQLVDSVKGVFKDTSSDVTGLISKTIEEQLGSYNEDKKTIAEFGNELKKIGSVLKEKIEFPLLIIVDELDRCRPDFALKLIERIKHLFFVDNVSFVLLTNLDQLENHVKRIYGGIDAFTYLQKFFTARTTLPNKKTGIQGINHYRQYTNHLIEHYRLGNILDDRLLFHLFSYFDFSLREIEQCFKILLFYYGSLSRNASSHLIIVHFLAVIRIYDPDVFYQLSQNTIRYTELEEKFFEEKFLIETDTRNENSSIMNIIRMFLVLEAEFNNLSDELKNPILNIIEPFGIKRIDFIPFLCEELDRIKNF